VELSNSALLYGLIFGYLDSSSGDHVNNRFAEELWVVTAAHLIHNVFSNSWSVQGVDGSATAQALLTFPQRWFEVATKKFVSIQYGKLPESSGSIEGKDISTQMKTKEGLVSSAAGPAPWDMWKEIIDANDITR